MVSATSIVVEVSGAPPMRAVARDRARRAVELDLTYAWRMLEGEGSLEPTDGEITTFRAANEPGLARVEVIVTQGDIVCRADAQITVAASLVARTGSGDATYQGLPGYTYQKAAGELWRSRFDTDRNPVVINNGHSDFVYAARNKMLKHRYTRRGCATEHVHRNRGGLAPGQHPGRRCAPTR